MEEKKKVVRYKLIRHKWPDEIAAEKAKRSRKIMMVAFCMVCFVLGFLSSTLIFKNPSSNSNESTKMETVYELMRDDWYFGKGKKGLSTKLSTGAINGMVNSGGDSHSIYMSAEEAKDFTSSLQGNYVGIGIQYYTDTNYVVVAQVFKDSSAEEAGVMNNDQIIEVDGKPLKDIESEKVANLIRGKEGTKVVLTILREGKEITLEVERRKFDGSVIGYIKDKSIGVIELTSFAETTGAEVGKYLKIFKDQGIEKLVFDLRDNPGGYALAAQQVASYFAPENTPVYVEEVKDGTRTTAKTLEGYPLYQFRHIAVVVNNDTASSSEILTAFMKEQINAVVVGDTTYGKGSIQMTHPFEDGSSLKYTVGQWFTSKAKKVNGKGIKPDHKVDLDPALFVRIPKFKKAEQYSVDSVSYMCQIAQYYLKFIGYDIDRTDGYFSIKTLAAVKQYQQDKSLEVTGIMDETFLLSAMSSAGIHYQQNKDVLDTQMMKAIEVINGK